MLSLKKIKSTAAGIFELRHELKGFGGHCAAGALALNEVCFENKACIRGVFNKGLKKKNRYVGHFYIYFKEFELGLDCEGILRRPSFFNQYAFLDLKDPLDSKLIKEFGLDLSSELVEVESVAVSKEDPLFSRFCLDFLEHNKQTLQKML